MAKAKQKKSANLFKSLACGAVAALLLVVSGLTWWGYSFATGMVRDELSAQKIYFPAKGAPNFKAEDYPELQKYAGQLVDDGVKAKAYANGYIGRHIKKVANGKTYSEVSAEFQKNPKDEKLAAQRESLFMGETLRGILLGTGYAYWTIGMIAKYVSLVALAAAVAFGLLAVLFQKRR